MINRSTNIIEWGETRGNETKTLPATKWKEEKGGKFWKIQKGCVDTINIGDKGRSTGLTKNKEEWWEKTEFLLSSPPSSPPHASLFSLGVGWDPLLFFPFLPFPMSSLKQQTNIVYLRLFHLLSPKSSILCLSSSSFSFSMFRWRVFIVHVCICIYILGICILRNMYMY